MSVRKRTWTNAKGEQREAWIVDYRDRQGDRHIETFTRKKDADAKHAEVDVSVRSGVHVAAGKSKTVAEAGEIWIDAAKLEGLERSTVEQYRGHLDKHIAPALGAKKLSDLSRADVQDFSDNLRKDGMSPAMVKKVMASLGSLIAEAQDRDLVARNVVRALARTRKKRKGGRDKPKLKIGVDIPAPEEISVILAQAKGRWRPLLLVAAFTGLRASELRGLRWADVDLKANKLHVIQRADKFHKIGSPKTEAGKRDVPFGPTVHNTLKEWKLACPKSELDLVFPNTRGNIEGLPNILTRGFIPTVIAAGAVKADGSAKYTGLHTLRHFYASWCIDRGLPPKVIQELLGHTSITMTFDRYGHLFPKADDPEEIAAAELAVVRRA
ncbi:MAG: site-specific integrase [Methyloceanibacter sp.]